jgi:hypothetical protein
VGTGNRHEPVQLAAVVRLIATEVIAAEVVPTEATATGGAVKGDGVVGGTVVGGTVVGRGEERAVSRSAAPPAGRRDARRRRRLTGACDTSLRATSARGGRTARSDGRVAVREEDVHGTIRTRHRSRRNQCAQATTQATTSFCHGCALLRVGDGVRYRGTSVLVGYSAGHRMTVN